MVISSINRFSLPLLGSYYRILLSVDFDSQLGSCYWYIQGNYWQGWCDDKLTYMAREISPHCYIGWSLSVASHRHSTEPARRLFQASTWRVRLQPLNITIRHRCRGYIYCQYGEYAVVLWRGMLKYICLWENHVPVWYITLWYTALSKSRGHFLRITHERHYIASP